ncbi:MAG: hypothetical protein FD174_3598 [Geobacteraceae bacterium]|nr:MAG: hypothetical protein FD174_3598 [Geobacteraceae bacterium]
MKYFVWDHGKNEKLKGQRGHFKDHNTQPEGQVSSPVLTTLRIQYHYSMSSIEKQLEQMRNNRVTGGLKP